MTQPASKPMWSFDSKTRTTMVHQLGPHRCGCDVVYMCHDHGTEGPADVAATIRQLPAMWLGALDAHYGAAHV